MFAQGVTPGVDRGLATLPKLTEMTRMAAEYKKLNPHVTIEYVELPTMNPQEYMSWVVTQSLGGSIPDIVWAHATELEAYSTNGWFVDLKPYLEKPNKYVQGNTRWMDLFGDKIISTRLSSTGKLWSLPTDMVATAIFYNKDIFDKLGLKPPKTWAEFMAVSKKLKDSGVTPLLFDMSNTTHFSWSFRTLLSYYYEDQLPLIDVLPKDDIVSAEEFARAVKKGLVDAKSERHQEIFKLYDEWKNYFQEGFLAAPTPGMFERGQTAMWWGGIFNLLALEMNPDRKFNYSTFYFPPVTSATSKFITKEVPVRMIGGAAGVQFAVTKSAIDKKAVDQAVDFLQFITTPENNGAVYSEAKTTVPIVIGAKAPDMFKSFMEQSKNGISTFILERYTNAEQKDIWLSSIQLYLTGKYNLAKISEEMQKMYMSAADTLIAANKYDQSKW